MAEEARHPGGTSHRGLILESSKLPLALDPLGPVHHELKTWFALFPSRVRSAIAERPVFAADTIAVHESARRRCWDPSRAPYRAWRPDVKWQFRIIDRLTLQRDLWLLYERPAPSPGKPAWWESLRPKDIAELVELTRALVAAGPLKDGPSNMLEIRGGEQLARSLCVLFLFAGKDPLRVLIDACDNRFAHAYAELVSLKDDKAMLHVHAKAWKKLTESFDAALAEAGDLLPRPFADAYNATVWPPDKRLTLSARAALRINICNLLATAPL